MTPSSDPNVEPSYTRTSVEAYLRAVADQREQIESEIDEARARAERARRELAGLGGVATATVTPIPGHAAAAASTDTDTHSDPGADTGSNNLIGQLRLTMPSEGERWEHSEVPKAVVNE